MKERVIISSKIEKLREQIQKPVDLRKKLSLKYGHYGKTNEYLTERRKQLNS